MMAPRALALTSTSIALLFLACSSSSATAPAAAGDSGATDASASPEDASSSQDASHADGGAGGDAGSNAIRGTYGADPIKPVMAAYWVGAPANPAESGGGPFLYLFSGAVSCADLSSASGWLTTIPTGTQVLELIVGTVSVATPVPAAAHAAPNAAEVNYATGGSSAEARATSGNVTLTSYTKGVAVDGTVDVTFPSGAAKGTFHATWCAAGHEL